MCDCIDNIKIAFMKKLSETDGKLDGKKIISLQYHEDYETIDFSKDRIVYLVPFQLETENQKKKKSIGVPYSFCPFCGEKIVKDDDEKC